MKRVIGIAITGVLVWATAGWCEDHSGHSHAEATQPASMAMPKPGAETKALAELFDGTFTWTGTMLAGAMGPESQEMPTKGKAVCRPTADGFWYVCDIESKAGDGKTAMTWKGNVLVGYDMGTKTYRATSVDNMGTLAVYRGAMEGDKFTLETVEPTMMMGMVMDDRLIWEKTAGGTWNFKEENRMQGADWKACQTATMTSSKAKAGSKAKKSTAAATGE